MNKTPKKICQYGEDCYRKNPAHFSEFSHPHLETIFKKGLDPTTRQYNIPNDLLLIKDVVLTQLKILEDLFPELQLEEKDKDEGRKQEEKKKLVPDNGRKQKEKKLERKENDVKPKNNSVVYVSDDEKPSTSAAAQKLVTNTAPLKTSRERSPTPQSVTDGSRLSKKPKINRNIHDYIQVVVEKGQMAKKLDKAAPYNFFLTTITDSKPTHNEPLSITMQEILDGSLGEIESSLQINFMVDIGWLLGHYYFANILETPLLILYGDETPELRSIAQKSSNVTAIKVQMPNAFATHHTKMMLLGYKDGSMRVVISTANLYEDDWHNRTQGLWMSPKLSALPDDANTTDGESPTGFRNDLMLYLVEYKISKLQPWIARIRKTDFSSINVFLIASVPGGFRETQRGHPWGHARLGSILNKHSAPIDDACPIVAQSSSIGSLGQNFQTWIGSDITNSFRKDSAPLGIRKIPQFKMIYPSFGNVTNSHDGMLGGGCLPYGKQTNDKQLWLKDYLHHWKAKSSHRNQAMPHIKTYCRWSDRGLYWFVLTSANLSKAAWGAFNKTSKIEASLRIYNYEAGVLFLPKFITGENFFPLNANKNGVPKFPIPYDIPLTPYGPEDKPFLMDYLRACLN